MSHSEALGLPSRLTREELAAFWRVSTRTIERWNAQGLCPQHVRIGGRILPRRDDILAWEHTRLVQMQPDEARD